MLRDESESKLSTPSYKATKLPQGLPKIDPSELHEVKAADSKESNYNLRTEDEIKVLEQKLAPEMKAGATTIHSKKYLKQKYRVETHHRTLLVDGELHTVAKGIRLGEGTFGKVKIVQDTKGNVKALKVIEGDNWDEVKQEAAMLEKAGLGRQIVFDKARAIGEEAKPKIYVLMNYIPGKELFDFLKMGNLAPMRRLDIALQILEIVAQLQEAGIAHRDIKSENFMYDPRNNKVVLIDFGLAKEMKNGQFTGDPAGTPGFIAPEVIREYNLFKQSRFNEKTEIFAVGRTLEELFGIADTDKSIGVKHFGTVKTELSSDKELETLVRSMVVATPSQRIPLKSPSVGSPVKNAIDELKAIRAAREKDFPIKVFALTLQEYALLTPEEKPGIIAGLKKDVDEVLLVDDGITPISTQSLMEITAELEEAGVILRPDKLLNPDIDEVDAYLQDTVGHPFIIVNDPRVEVAAEAKETLAKETEIVIGEAPGLNEEIIEAIKELDRIHRVATAMKMDSKLLEALLEIKVYFENPAHRKGKTDYVIVEEAEQKLAGLIEKFKPTIGKMLVPQLTQQMKRLTAEKAIIRDTETELFILKSKVESLMLELKEQDPDLSNAHIKKMFSTLEKITEKFNSLVKEYSETETPSGYLNVLLGEAEQLSMQLDAVVEQTKQSIKKEAPQRKGSDLRFMKAVKEHPSIKFLENSVSDAYQKSLREKYSELTKTPEARRSFCLNIITPPAPAQKLSAR